MVNKISKPDELAACISLGQNFSFAFVNLEAKKVMNLSSNLGCIPSIDKQGLQKNPIQPFSEQNFRWFYLGIQSEDSHNPNHESSGDWKPLTTLRSLGLSSKHFFHLKNPRKRLKL